MDKILQEGAMKRESRPFASATIGLPVIQNDQLGVLTRSLPTISPNRHITPLSAA